MLFFIFYFLGLKGKWLFVKVDFSSQEKSNNLRAVNNIQVKLRIWPVQTVKTAFEYEDLFPHPLNWSMRLDSTYWDLALTLIIKF